MTGNLREQMLEEDHRRALLFQPIAAQKITLSFSETIVTGNRSLSRTATTEIAVDGGSPELAMEFLKQSVRDKPE